MKWALVLVALTAVAGCHGHSSTPGQDGGTDRAGDAIACGAGDGAHKINGAACGCNADCGSGFCVDGVCCATACNETCKRCDVAGVAGTCSFVPGGDLPRSASTCPASAVATCGLDGTCDGKGACRKYTAGVTCQPGQCVGASLQGANVCDGQGACRPGAAVVCAPFGCDGSMEACRNTCGSDGDCASGIKCVNGSCGPKPPGAVCKADSECASGFCTDGVCCNVACRGACISCNQAGRLGTCWPFEAGRMDPHNICVDQGAATCGRTGACDGVGGCARYPQETVCTAPSCDGDRLNTAGTCDGLGTCRAPGVQNCPPYRCIDGACVNKCASDNDCVTGHACQAGSCGLKTNGQVCGSSTECVSGFCVDGVCCNVACQGACRSCALPSALGQCSAVPASADDPRNMCLDQGAGSCGTNKKCDGAGACQKYKTGTICAPEGCSNNVYTPEAICNASGVCVAPDSIACPPYACNGSKCFGACTVDANCSPNNVCTSNSCGLKPIGAFCADRSECASGNCAQGACCATACASSCKSCALAGTMGQCSNVPKDSPDPTETCLDQGTGTCGTTGKCEAGACQKYAQGTSCKDASCPSTGTTLTPGSQCDGAGTCLTPAAISCFPFGCGTAACRSTCSADGDCAPPASCNMGSCGLKPPDAICGSGAECSTGICAQGICCTTTCTQSCMSCAVPGKLGTCSHVPASGTDPAGVCTNQGATSCGTTGFCDGAGACQLFAAGVQCAGPSCAIGSATATLARTCDGSGSCRPAATQSCGSYACNGTACNAACGLDADCSSGNFCNAGSCGLKRLGQACSAAPDCDSGNCVDGVCCSSASCGSCTACNISGSAGTCQPIPSATMDPHGRCALGPPCGFDGTCDGLGGCRNSPATTSCGSASCAGSTFTAVGSCDGAGACKQASSGCAPYVCGANACLTTCSGNGDCAPGAACLSGSCTTLKANGATCASGAECISTSCADGVCCNVGCTGACQICNKSGAVGICTPADLGTSPRGGCAGQSAASCGTTGVCDAAGNCALYGAGTTCLPSSCADGTSSLTTSTCDGAGNCGSAVTSCAPYVCEGAQNICKTSCTDPTDCSSGFACSVSGGATGSCQ